MAFRKTLLSLSILPVLLTGCNGGSSSGDTPQPSQTEQKTLISGVVTDSLSKKPIKNVTVTLNSKTIKTNDKGEYSFTLDKAYKGEASLTASGYASKKATVSVDKNKTKTFNIQLTPVSSVAGKVTDKDTAKPLANITVKVGTAETKTNANGEYLLTNVPVKNNQTIVIQSDTHVSSSINTNISRTKLTGKDAQLIKLQALSKALPTKPITVTVNNSPAQISIPANSLVREDGKPIQGKVSVSAATINPALNPKLMPGGYNIAGGGYMESFGAIDMSALDESGAKVTLAQGKEATVRIPLATRGQYKTSMPMWFFDSKQNAWVKKGNATLASASARSATTTSTTQTVSSVSYFEGKIDQIGAWNIDLEMEVTQLNGCVKNSNGDLIKNAQVTADGINYSALTNASTDASGNFSVPVRKNSQLYVLAQSGVLLSNAVKVTTSSNEMTLPECLVVTSQNNSFTVRLTWGEKPSDVDSHLLTPNNQHIYFGNKGKLSAEPFANLDVDDLTSFGPEVITVRKMMVGTYKYGVHNYSSTYNPALTGSPIRVELAGATGINVFGAPAGETNNYKSKFLHLFNVEVDKDCKATVVPINKWQDSRFSTDTPSTPEYCTPTE